MFLSVLSFLINLYTDGKRGRTATGRVLRVALPFLMAAILVLIAGTALSLYVDSSLVFFLTVAAAGVLLFITLMSPWLPLYPYTINNPNDVYLTRGPLGQIMGLRRGLGCHWLRPLWSMELLGRRSFHQATIDFDRIPVRADPYNPDPTPDIISMKATIPWQYDPYKLSEDNWYDALMDPGVLNGAFAAPVRRRIRELAGGLDWNTAISPDGINQMLEAMEETIVGIFGNMGVHLFPGSTALELQIPDAKAAASDQLWAAEQQSFADLKPGLVTIEQALRRGINPAGLAYINVISKNGARTYLPRRRGGRSMYDGMPLALPDPRKIAQLMDQPAPAPRNYLEARRARLLAPPTPAEHPDIIDAEFEEVHDQPEEEIVVEAESAVQEEAGELESTGKRRGFLRRAKPDQPEEPEPPEEPETQKKSADEKRFDEGTFPRG